MTTALTVPRAEELIKLLTEGLVNIVDETGEFLLKRGWLLEAELTVVDDGSVIDTKGWGGWEWTHGIALTSLYHVRMMKFSLKTARGSCSW